MTTISISTVVSAAIQSLIWYQQIITRYYGYTALVALAANNVLQLALYPPAAQPIQKSPYDAVGRARTILHHGQHLKAASCQYNQSCKRRGARARLARRKQLSAVGTPSVSHPADPKTVIRYFCCRVCQHHPSSLSAFKSHSMPVQSVL